jgi:hypothetical protein
LIEEIGQGVWYCGHVPFFPRVLSWRSLRCRSHTSASFIESGAYLKEFRKILSTSDARTISSTVETRTMNGKSRTERLHRHFEPNEENRPMAPDQLTFAQPASMLFPFPTEGVAV